MGVINWLVVFLSGAGLLACSPEREVAPGGERSEQRAALSEKVNRREDLPGGVLDYTAFSVYRLLEVKMIFERALGPLPKTPCLSEKIFPVIAPLQIREVQARGCLGESRHVLAAVNALEHFHLRAEEGSARLAHLLYFTTSFATELQRRNPPAGDASPEDAPTTTSRDPSMEARAFLPEERRLEVYRENVVKTSDPLRYRFHYRVVMPGVRQTLTDDEYRIQETRGILEVIASGYLVVGRGGHEVLQMEDLEIELRRQGERTVEKKIGERIKPLATRTSQLRLRLKAIDEEMSSALAFHGGCRRPLGQLHATFESGRPSGQYCGGVQVLETEWSSEMPLTFKTLDHCVGDGAPFFIPYDLIFLR